MTRTFDVTIPMGSTQDLFHEGDRCLTKGDWDGASKAFGKAIGALEQEEQTEDCKRRLAEAYRKKGFADSRIGEIGKAVLQAKKALDISENIGDTVGEADALRRLGYVHWLKGDVKLAEDFYSKALEKAVECGDRDLEGKIRIEVGNSYNTQGDLDRSKDEYLKAIDILKEVENMNELARAYNNLGDCYIKAGELEEAVTVLRRCMDIGGDIGDLTIKGWAAFNAADCFTRMNETKMAKEYLDLAIEVLEKSDDRIGLASALSVYGRTFTAEKEWVLAEDAFNKSYAIATELEMPGLEGEVLMAKAKMFIQRSEIAVAKDLLERAIDLFREGNRKNEADEAKGIMKDLMDK